MTRRVDLAKLALGRALRLRRAYGLAVTTPVCPFDVAEWRGIEVRFVDVPSMEAMYRGNESPTILINANRPMGRRAFSCAHELAHHEFGHGSRIDDVSPGGAPAGRKVDEEYLADTFAGFLLMPKSVVEHALAVRGLTAATATAEQLFLVAGALGVSFEALITQLQWTLALVAPARGRALLATSLPVMRRFHLGRDCDERLLVVDRFWSGRAVDIEVGDLVLAPADTMVADDRLSVVERHDDRVLLRGAAPGVTQLMLGDGSWSSFARVSRPGFVGRAVFRHLPDEDHE